ncbi:MAG: rhomboid family intramembrane serine protease [Fidelibacterota bacterium]
MFFPYKDDNPRVLVPYVMYGIITLNILVFLFQMGLPTLSRYEFTLSYGLIPGMLGRVSVPELLAYHSDYLSQLYAQYISVEATPHSPVMTIFTSMFIHGGLAHILGNMWFLWIFGDNVESSLGHARFALFYLLSGVGAALAQITIDPGSVIPMIGASGAIAGVLGAYMIRFPRSNVHVFLFLFIFFTTIRVPAFIVIGFWFLEQLTNGLGSLGLNTTGGVAWFAHVGGFIAGVGFERLFRQNRRLRWI